MRGIELSQGRMGIEQILIDDVPFDVHPGVIDHEGAIESGSLSRVVVGDLWTSGALIHNPPVVYGVTTMGKPATISIGYGSGRPLYARAALWARAPNLNAALKHIGHHSKKSGLIVIPPVLDLSLAQQDEPAVHDSQNPFVDLERFRKDVYDGSLPFEELRRFVGKRFGGELGGPTGAYVVHYKYKGDEIGKGTPSDDQPVPGQQRYGDLCLFEITRVSHRRFIERIDPFTLANPRDTFQQELDAELRYVDFMPQIGKFSFML